MQSVTAGYYFACALSAGDNAQCWGQGIYGQLGNGAMSNSNLPVSVSGWRPATLATCQ